MRKKNKVRDILQTKMELDKARAEENQQEINHTHNTGPHEVTGDRGPRKTCWRNDLDEFQKALTPESWRRNDLEKTYVQQRILKS